MSHSSLNSSSNPNLFSPSKAAMEGPLQAPKIMDKGWEVIQKKTFTNWINNKLKLKQVAPLDSIDTDFSSGEKLIQLLEIIGDESLGKYNKNPKMKLQKIENLNSALAFIKRRGVGLTNIGSEDIFEGNVKLILGMIWSIILRFTIADISEGGLTAKEGLLLWVQKRTTPYAQDFYVKDFTTSWQDGLVFCALIHRHRPDLLNYWQLDKTKRHENTALAFEIAETQLGIPKLFAVEDIVDVAKPDERSVMTYVAQYFHAFSQMDKLGTAGRRVGQFGEVMSQIWNMKHDYEQRVTKLMADMSSIQHTWTSSSFNGYPDAKRQLVEFDNYKNTTKRGWVAEKRDLDTVLGNIQTKLITYNLPSYTPPAGLSLQDLDVAWTTQIKVEAERKRSISAYIKEIKEVLKSKYASAANTFHDDLNRISVSLAGLEGELEAQLDSVRNLILKLEPLKGDLNLVDQLNNESMEANIEDNEYTIFSLEDLTFEMGILAQSLAKKAAFIENQMVARTMTNITPQQLEGFSETFRHFDKENSNCLHKDEFKAALQAEGTDCSEAELDALFKNNNSTMSFEKFIEFMRNHQEDKTSPEQLAISFQAIGGEKGYVTEADMYMSALPPTVVEYFKQAMPSQPGAEGGFDYKTYLKETFGR